MRPIYILATTLFLSSPLYADESFKVMVIPQGTVLCFAGQCNQTDIAKPAPVSCEDQIAGKPAQVTGVIVTIVFNEGTEQEYHRYRRFMPRDILNCPNDT